MKKDEIKIGEVYIAKISNKLSPVRILSVGNFRTNGWNGLNLRTNAKVFIKSAAKLRYTQTQWNELQARIKATREDRARAAEIAKCPKCGAVQHPDNNACWNCLTKFSVPVPHASQT